MKQEEKEKAKQFLKDFAAITVMLAMTAGMAVKMVTDFKKEFAERARMGARTYSTRVISKSVVRETTVTAGRHNQETSRWFEIGLDIEGNPYGDPNVDDNPDTPEFILYVTDNTNRGDDVGYLLSRLKVGDRVDLTGQEWKPDSAKPTDAHTGGWGRNIANFDEIMGKYGTYQAAVTGIEPLMNHKGVLMGARVEFTTDEGYRYALDDYDYRLRMGDKVYICTYFRPSKNYAENISRNKLSETSAKMLEAKFDGMTEEEYWADRENFRTRLMVRALKKIK